MVKPTLDNVEGGQFRLSVLLIFAQKVAQE